MHVDIMLGVLGYILLFFFSKPSRTPPKAQEPKCNRALNWEARTCQKKQDSQQGSGILTSEMYADWVYYTRSQLKRLFLIHMYINKLCF